MTEPTIGFEPGWAGAFTRHQAAGAIANGADIVKTRSEVGDTHKDGARGTVLGSVSHPDVQDGAILYFVEWRTLPRVAVGVMDFKIEALRTVWAGGMQ
jgi:hypothetical protein